MLCGAIALAGSILDEAQVASMCHRVACREGDMFKEVADEYIVYATCRPHGLAGRRGWFDGDVEFQQWAANVGEAEGVAELLGQIPGGWCGVLKVGDEVVLACDRIGLRDLYYTVHEGIVYFSTVIKAFFGIAGWTTGTDAARVCEYMAYRRIAGAHTLYRNVSRVLPGAWVQVGAGRTGVNSQQYWSYHWDVSTGLSFADASQRLLAEIDAAVERARSLSPFVMLSGGIDSAAIMASVVRQKLAWPAMTLVPDHSQFSEDDRVREIEQRLKIESRRVGVNAQTLCEHLDRAHDVLEQPVVHTIALQHMQIYEKASAAGHQSLITGEAADTLMGYDRFARYYYIWRHDYAWLRRIMTRLQSISGKFRLWDALTSPHWNQWVVRSRAGLTDEDLQELLKAWVDPHHSRELMIAFESRDSPEERLEKASRYYFETFIQDCRIFVALGRAAGLEPILPFTASSLRDYALSLPPRFKFKGMCGKYLLKKAHSGRLPPAVVWGRKRSGEQPLGIWMREHVPLRQLVIASGSESACIAPYFNLAVVQGIIREHMDGEADHSGLLWQILSLERWLQWVAHESS